MAEVCLGRPFSQLEKKNLTNLKRGDSREPALAQFFLSIILFSLVGLLHLLPNPLPHPLLLEEPPAELEGFLFVSPLKRYPRVLGIPGS